MCLHGNGHIFTMHSNWAVIKLSKKFDLAKLPSRCFLITKGNSIWNFKRVVTVFTGIAKLVALISSFRYLKKSPILVCSLFIAYAVSAHCWCWIRSSPLATINSWTALATLSTSICCTRAVAPAWIASRTIVSKIRLSF